MFRRSQPQIRPDRGSGESRPVSDLDSKPEASSHRNATKTHQSIDYPSLLGLNDKARDRGIETFDVSYLQRLGLELGCQRLLRGNRFESLPGQPVVMRRCPFRILGVVQTVPKDHRIDPLSGGGQIEYSALSCPGDVAQTFLLD